MPAAKSRDAPRHAECRVTADSYVYVVGRLLAGSAKSRNGRDHFAIGREAVYRSHPVPRRLLSDLPRTRHRGAVGDSHFVVATRRPEGLQEAASCAQHWTFPSPAHTRRSLLGMSWQTASMPRCMPLTTYHFP